VRERNGQFCTCLTTGTSALVGWFDYRVATGMAQQARKVTGVRTGMRCGDEGKSAKSNRCACECAGEFHGMHRG